MTNHTLERHFTVEDYFKVSKVNVSEQTSLLHIFHEHVVNTPDAICCLYPIPPANMEYEKMTFKRLWTLSDKLFGKIVHRVPRRRAEGFASLLQPGSDRPVIGLLSDNNSFSLLMMIALMRCDVTILMLSTRNSMAGLESLCNETRASCILTTSKWSAKFAKSKLLTLVDFTEMTLEEIDALAPSNIELRAPRPKEIFETAFIYHSSGSTRHPSPIAETNLACVVIADGAQQWSEGVKHGLSVAPLFHAFGLFAFVTPCLAGVSVPGLPLTSSVPPKASQLMRSMEKGNIDLFATVPIMYESLIEYLDEHPEEWEILKGVKCTYGGAPLPNKVAKKMQEKGVEIYSGYGSTEIGFGMVGPDTDKENQGLEERWKFLKPAEYLSYKMVPQPDEPSLYELVVLSDSPCFLESIRNCDDGYATKDLFQPAPLYNTWIFRGRRDDTIVHVNGEKTNALAIENSIQLVCSAVQRAAVVGSGKPRAGVLIELSSSVLIPGDVNATVLEAVHQANREAPNHSHIMDEMVYILPKGQTLPVTNKGNLKRSLITKLYAAEIDQLYQGHCLPAGQQPSQIGRSHGNTVNSTPGTRYQTEQAIRHHLVDRISVLLGTPAEDIEAETHVSLFDQGLTSQMALSLSTTLQEISGTEMSANYLFEHSSIDGLVEGLMAHNGVVASTAGDKLAASHTSMRNIIDQYRLSLGDIASILPTHTRVRTHPTEAENSSNDNTEKCVLITGATGALGCHLTCQFLRNPSVKKVYALVRGQDVAVRLEKTAEKRGLNLSMALKSGRLEVLNYDMTDHFLGLPRSRYDELAKEVTDVVHNAWKMNFNLKVEDFNKDCIRGAFNLIKFCILPLDGGLKSYRKKKFNFISSVSAMCNYPGGSIPAKVMPDDQVTMAMPMGYGQSKCVTELVIHSAAKELGIAATIFRCGQLSGDTHLGVWTPTDMVALLTIGGGVRLGKIPAMCSDASFAPMDVAAAGIAELMSVPPEEGDCQVYHISNPNPAEWDDWLKTLREEGVDFETVSTSEFLQEIKKHPDNECNLLGSFLEKLPDIPAEGLQAPKLDMSETVNRSPSLRDCPPLTAELTSKYLGYWRSIGLIQ